MRGMRPVRSPPRQRAPRSQTVRQRLVEECHSKEGQHLGFKPTGTACRLLRLATPRAPRAPVPGRTTVSRVSDKSVIPEFYAL